MRNPLRSEAEAFRFLVVSIVGALLIVAGAFINTWVGVAVAVIVVGVIVLSVSDAGEVDTNEDASNVASLIKLLLGLALIALALPFLGLTDGSTIFALVLLGVPPILTNTYVGVREVDGDHVHCG